MYISVCTICSKNHTTNFTLIPIHLKNRSLVSFHKITIFSLFLKQYARHCPGGKSQTLIANYKASINNNFQSYYTVLPPVLCPTYNLLPNLLRITFRSSLAREDNSPFSHLPLDTLILALLLVKGGIGNFLA